MAYTYEELLKMGAKPVENTSKGLSYEELLKMGAKPVEPTQQTQPIEQRPVDYWNEGLKVSGKENFGELVGKGFSNIPASTARLAKGMVWDLPKLAFHDIPKAIGEDIGLGIMSATDKNVREGLKQQGYQSNISKLPEMGKALLGSTGITEQSVARAKAFSQWLNGRSIKDILSDPQFLEAETKPLVNLAKMGIEDPVGTALLAEGAIKASPTLNKGLQKVSKGVESVIKAPFKGIGKLSEVAASQVMGFEPKTIKTIGQYPEEFKFGQTPATREALGENVFGRLSKRLDELKSTGREYGGIRKQGDIVNIPEGFFEKELSNLGLSVENGKVLRSPSSPPISAGDAKKLEDFLQVYGKSKTMNPAEFLNTRQFLSDLSDFGVDKTDHLNMMARQIRNNFNEIGQDKIEGLTKLDAKFADEMSELSRVKRDYFEASGTLKDGAINKLANLTGKGKDRIIARLENIIPDVRKQIDVVKAYEDMQAVKGQKVGTYIRAGLGVGGLATGNPLMLAIGALGLSPELSSQLVKFAQQGSKGLGQFFDDLNNLRIKNILPKPKLQMRKGSFTPFEDINPKNITPEVGVGDELAKGLDYRGSHQIRDAVSIDSVDLEKLKEEVRALDGYISNEKLKDFNNLKKLYSNPDAKVKIYRASPVNELNGGDWVTTNKAYANNIKQQPRKHQTCSYFLIHQKFLLFLVYLLNRHNRFLIDNFFSLLQMLVKVLFLLSAILLQSRDKT